MPDAASAAYARVDKPRQLDAMATWNLADRRVKKLRAVAAVPAPGAR